MYLRKKPQIPETGSPITSPYFNINMNKIDIPTFKSSSEVLASPSFLTNKQEEAIDAMLPYLHAEQSLLSLIAEMIKKDVVPLNSSICAHLQLTIHDLDIATDVIAGTTQKVSYFENSGMWEFMRKVWRQEDMHAGTLFSTKKNYDFSFIKSWN